MLRRMFTFMTIVSLLLCVATCVLWVFFRDKGEMMLRAQRIWWACSIGFVLTGCAAPPPQEELLYRDVTALPGRYDFDADAGSPGLWQEQEFLTSMGRREAAVRVIAVVRAQVGLRRPGELAFSPVRSVIDSNGERSPTAAERAADTANPWSVTAAAVALDGRIVRIQCEASADGKTFLNVRSNLPTRVWGDVVFMVRRAVEDRSAPLAP